MKKLSILIISILFSLTCLGQQTISVNNVAKVDMPKGFEKITKDSAIAHVHNKLKNNQIVLKSIASRKPDHMYKVGDVLVSFNTDDRQSTPNHLMELKNGSDAMFKDISSYSSSIKKYNNNSALILYYPSGDIWHYRFFASNADNSRLINGALEFSAADKEKAAAVLDRILNSIKFEK